MARARNIKPGFFKNEDLAECTPWARLCFAGLWMLADREGRLEDRPKRIKGELFPFDSVEVDPLLVELERWSFIRRYEVAGTKCIQIVKFTDHQNVHAAEVDSAFPDVNGRIRVHERGPKGLATGKWRDVEATSFHPKPDMDGCKNQTHEASPIYGEDEKTDPEPIHIDMEGVKNQIHPPKNEIWRGAQIALNPESLNPESLNPLPTGREEREPQAASPPPAGQAKKPKRAECTLSAYLAECKATGVKAVPDGHAIRRWAQDAGIDDEMLHMAWIAFRERYTDDPQYAGMLGKDWPARFANSVKDCWFGLWFVDNSGAVKWSSKGLLRKQALEARNTAQQAQLQPQPEVSNEPA